MSNYEPFPGNNPNNEGVPVGEQMPHSGVHGYEQPVNEFDNTSLHEAYERGYLQTPHSPAPLVEQPKPKMPTWKKAGAAAALLAGGVAGAVAFAKVGGDNSRTYEATAPSVSATSEPTPEVEDLEPPEIPLVTIDKYPTPEEAAAELWSMRSEYFNLQMKDMKPIYGVAKEAWFHAIYNGDSDDMDSIDMDYETNAGRIWGDNEYRRNQVDLYKDQLKEDGVNVDYAFEIYIDEILRVDGNTVTFREATDSNYDQIPADYQDPGMPGDYIETPYTVTVELGKESGRWYIKNEFSTIE